MILVTGSTGFVGRALVPRLVEGGATVRCLIRPSKHSPRLPKEIPLQIAVAPITDFRGVRAAMVGVDTVIHLASAEWRGAPGGWQKVDIEGARIMLEAAKEAGVGRVVYLSHVGADKSSAYEAHRVKGQIEEMVRRSEIPYTIFRSTVLYGEEDAFANGIAMALATVPSVFLMPANGKTLLQPLWVEDLVTCIEWSLDDLTTINQTLTLGGPEFLSFEQMVKIIMGVTKLSRALVPVGIPYLWRGAAILERLLPRSPITTRWLDHLAVNRICELVSVTRYFGLKPARFEQTVGYMAGRDWGAEMRRFVWGR
ncbi:MAG: NAD-dependent epimerase/dehydratase family protein [Chloroflexi bacterium]|nr:NAD-dependent epimerase/dehydratase family protein [Chloroflexota bacterium]